MSSQRRPRSDELELARQERAGDTASVARVAQGGRALLGRRQALVSISGVVAGATAALGWARAARAHPYHVASAQAEWIQKDARVEVALRFLPEDLEAQLTLLHKRRVRLEHDADAGGLLAALFAREFQIRHGSHQAAMRWVGHEIGAAEAWAYFELHNVAALHEAVIRFSLMIAAEGAQANTLTLRSNEVVHTWLFRAGTVERTIHWPA